jgi:glycosyltransferase involved in cell wall biosynthesis
MPPATSWWQYHVRGPKKLWTWTGLPLALWRDLPKADVVFSPTHYIPRFVRMPKVMSIMDVSYLEYPHLFRQKDLYQLTKWTAYSASRAARILTISEFSKNAIIKAYGVAARGVTVTYPGFSMNTHKDASQSIGLNTPYILSVGTLQPRKNYVRLIEAFAEVLPKLRVKYPEMTLVIVGKKGWLYEDILSAPGRFGVEKQVKFLEFVPDEALPGLYEKAMCFALPSLYEGFGLPVLEAMAHGCPVVVSDVSSLPEIAGKAGIYVDPEDIHSIGKGLEQAIGEHATAVGKKRIDVGHTQVKKFTWKQAAQDTLQALEEVGGVL